MAKGKASPKKKKKGLSANQVVFYILSLIIALSVVLSLFIK
jgi:hypothetical protein